MIRASIIIPTYNRQELLARQLRCLCAQQGEFIEEVLVCDDGSSTDTKAVLEPFWEQLPGLQLLRHEDRGFRAGQARNMGIRVARGDILLFIDDDLLLPKNFVSEHVAAHAQHVNGSPLRNLVIGFRHRRSTIAGDIPTMAEILESSPDDRVEHIGPDGLGVAHHPRPWFFVYSCNLSVTNVRETVHFNEDFHGWGMEDIEFGYRLVKAGFQVIAQPTARVLHIEAAQPRDPFRCEERGLEPCYDSYVHNTVQFIDTYPDDAELADLLTSELRWYVRDEAGQHWIKNGYENDADAVLAEVRRLRAEATDLAKVKVEKTSGQRPETRLTSRDATR